MRSTKPIATAKFGHIVLAIVMGVLGVMLLCGSPIDEQLLCEMLGAILICSGILKVIGYLSKDLFRLAFQFDLAFGCLTALVGLTMVIHPNDLKSMLGWIFGILLLSDGMFKMQIAFDAKVFGIEKWWLIAALSAVTMGIGLVLLISPAAIQNNQQAAMGVALLAEAMLNLCVMICTVKIVKNQYPDHGETLDPKFKED